MLTGKICILNVQSDTVIDDDQARIDSIRNIYHAIQIKHLESSKIYEYRISKNSYIASTLNLLLGRNGYDWQLT